MKRCTRTPRHRTNIGEGDTNVMTRTGPRTAWGIALVSIAFFVAAALPSPAAAVTGKQPLAVVLCKFSDKTDEPHPTSYYEDMFTASGAGKQGVFDYWKDVSYGKLDLTGTVVKGWYELDMTLAEWQALGRGAARVSVCAAQAKDIDLHKFAGVVVLTNQVNRNEDLSGGKPPKNAAVKIGDTTYDSLGWMIAEEDQQFNGILHETGHSFGIDHSRTLTQQPGNSDYGDSWDVMSCFQCKGTTSKWGINIFGGGGHGPGLNAVQLDTAGWIPAEREVRDFDNRSCGQRTVELAALNHPEASKYLEARIPAAVPINKPVGPVSTTGDYYTVELRGKSGWDAALDQDVVLLHLHGQDGFSYWVDTSSVAGAFYKVRFTGESFGLYAGEEYVDTANNAYVAVNAIDNVAHKTTVTLGACKIDADIRYSGQTEVDFSDQASLATDLKVRGSGAPIPGKLVTLSLGPDACVDRTDSAGHASCKLNISRKPGSYTAGASFAGDPAYNAASNSVVATVDKEDTTIAYTGALTSDYHDPFTASATLSDPDASASVAGRTMQFELGAGDTCSAVSDDTGAGSCSIKPTQAAGTVDIVASFAGDDYYKPSTDKKSFAITREETTTSYIGPTVILRGASGVTLKAQLLEDGTTVPVPSGQKLTLSLGGQSCVATVGTDGIASCALTFTGALGPEALAATFAGDAYYEPSSDTGKTALVFAFPSRGAFVLGDNTVASAGALTTVTWWGDRWSDLNNLSGGVAPPAFKGFAEKLTSLPTSSPPAKCSGTWTTTGGNSPPPASGVPSYMGVVVASSITKPSSAISGNFGKIVVVKTNSGYAPTPDHHGTGTVVATFCQ